MLPGNKYRVVLESSSLNFELKSEQEQDALIDTYRSFLNSLPCPVQIVTRIRELDMTHYLETFAEAASLEPDPIYREQIQSYIEFVQGLITSNKILSRRFYIVLGHYDAEKAGLDSVREQLDINAAITSKGLGRLGLGTRRLGSRDVLGLFYSFYNPGLAKRQPLAPDITELFNQSVITEQ
jgi:hypothetical protein